MAWTWTNPVSVGDATKKTDWDKLWDNTDFLNQTLLNGYVQRPKFTFKDVDEIYISAGAYHHAGTVNQIVYWDSQITSDIGAPDASDFYYLYLDDSAIVTAGTNLLTSTEFVWSNTEPEWVHAKHGWYSSGVANDRCIFAVQTTAGNDIREFFHSGIAVYNQDMDTPMAATATVDQTWTDVTFTVPSFVREVMAGFELVYVDATAVAYWRVNGQGGTNGHRVGSVVAGSTVSVVVANAMVDDSLKLEVKTSATSNNTIAVREYGWYLPEGM